MLRFTLFWKTTEAAYRDVDGVVNANVLLYLGERSETMPVIEWLLDIVRNGKEAECDNWYRDPFTFYYALSRCRHAGMQIFDRVRSQIIANIQQASQSDGRIGEHVLHTALAANTLLNFGECSTLLNNSIAYILSTQREDGSWPSEPYYYGGPLRVTCWGSEELTTGICLEALARYGAGKVRGTCSVR
jgi:hypothetical protein